ncbi:MAG: elongation factor P [Patescibacteria group bacterium]|jgi:elongation factor P
MLSMNDLKSGTIIDYEDQPYEVLSKDFVKNAQRRPVMFTKLKNLISGKIIEHSFQQSDRLNESDVTKKDAQYMYEDNGNYNFMDSETYEQFSLAKNILGNKTDFLLENGTVKIVYYNNDPINIELPIKMEFKIIETAPGVKGNSATNAMKEATIETGKKIQVPLFVKEGDLIRIDSRTGEYLERV